MAAILTRSVSGFNEFVDEHPPVAPVFWGFRIMVGTGVLMIAVGLAGVFFLFKKRELPNLYLKLLVGMTFAGWVGTLAGWYVTEIGRQGADLPPSHVALTLSAYLITYVLLMIAYVGSLFYLANKEITTTPKELVKS